MAVIASPKSVEKVPAIEQHLSAGALCFAIVATATAAGWQANWLTGWPAHDAEFAAAAFGSALAHCPPDDRREQALILRSRARLEAKMNRWDEALSACRTSTA